MSPVKNPEATRIDIPGYAMGGWTTMQGGSMGRGGEREGEQGGNAFLGLSIQHFRWRATGIETFSR